MPQKQTLRIYPEMNKNEDGGYAITLTLISNGDQEEQGSRWAWKLARSWLVKEIIALNT